MFHSLYSTVHPRQAVISLYTADWAIDEAPKFRRLLTLPGQNPLKRLDTLLFSRSNLSLCHYVRCSLYYRSWQWTC